MTSSSRPQAAAGPAAAGSDLDALMQANIVRVFNERNPARRRAAPLCPTACPTAVKIKLDGNMRCRLPTASEIVSV